MIRERLARWLLGSRVESAGDLALVLAKVSSRQDALALRVEKLEGGLALLRAEVRGGPTGLDPRRPEGRGE